MQRIYPLTGKVQHYSWGGYEYIPQLLGIENKDRIPYGEYWLGAHPNHPSTLTLHGSSVSLFDFIKVERENVLGNKVNAQFGTLPFLLKVLDVRQMLSIQVHPDKESAASNFKKENEKGIPLNAPNRNYKDENHKPELMVALSDFWLLHGFKPEVELKKVLEQTTELSFLMPSLERGGYKQLFTTAMTLDQQEVNKIGKALEDKIMPLYKEGKLAKDGADFWAARAIETFCRDNQYDKGLFSIYFLNIVHLRKGEGVYQPQGLLHAYLEGQNVEIMANSDNVLRAGLTDKHIDVPELLLHVHFEPTYPDILKPGRGKETSFNPPVAEFNMVHYQEQAGAHSSLSSTGPEIILVIEGSIHLGQEGMELPLHKGEAAFVEAGTPFTIISDTDSVYFRAGVPNV